MSLIEQINELLRPPLEAIGASIREVALRVEGRDHVLHIALSRDSGPIDLDYIVRATEIISLLLDESNLIPHRYMLDVSSAGIEQPIPIEELPHQIGAYLSIHLRKPWRTENTLLATLVAIDSDTVTLRGNLKGRKYETKISIADIDSVREAIKF